MSSERNNHLRGLGAFIRSQRRLAELSQRELAKLTELSDPYVSQLERGMHEPSVRVLRALGSALGVPIDTLMRQAGWTDDSTADPSSDTAAAIRNDPALNARQKAALLEVYTAFAGDDGSSATPDTPQDTDSAEQGSSDPAKKPAAKKPAAKKPAKKAAAKKSPAKKAAKKSGAKKAAGTKKA